MNTLPPNNPNMPNQPTKPPDLSSTMIAQPPPIIPISNTGHTPPFSGLTPPNSPLIAETLALVQNDAAAPSNGGMPMGHPPIEAPPLDEQNGRSIEPQNLEPDVFNSDTCQNSDHALLHSGQSRATMPAPSGPFVSSIPPPIANVPYSAPIFSSQLVVPSQEEALPRAASSRATMPAPQAFNCVLIGQPNQGVPNSDRPHSGPILTPRVSSNPIAPDLQGAPMPAPGLPARTPAVRQQAT
ncbi:hypothetical protein Adt_49230 [Abeliophyllum distichum]|uniref:Uncharacterized protein n=1 Tax=Abeliophyllum distichum TaxID=126358 RepID=A0ABD1NPH7_9LAMI